LTALLSAPALAVAAPPTLAATTAPAWSEAQTRAILDVTQTIRLAPDLSHLTAGERAAVAKLLEVGRIFEDVYVAQNHAQALAAKATLRPGSDEATLYRLFKGPIATTLDNARVPFLPVAEPPPGKNVYPPDLTREEYEEFLAAHPELQRELMHPRAVIRRADRESLARDLATLRAHPAIDGLHPGLMSRLEAMASQPDRTFLYALPYSVAYAPEMTRAHALLNEAADAVDADDWQFARYLRNRARDLLSDDYESGDAAWLKGRFNNLNAQIGAYETHDDELAATRAFYSLSLLATRREESAALREAMSGIQALEDSLPYESDRKVGDSVPVGAYDVIADFAQARGGNTATNLPNESYLVERYGNIVLLRANIMRNPDLLAGSGDVFGAAIVPEQAGDLGPDGSFYRTLWHEVGHYIGPDYTASGETLDALGADSGLLEELKADLVSLYLAPELHRRGYYDDAGLRAVQAAGILRVLQNNPPRREQPYNMMQLMQWNWFLDRGVLAPDPASGKLRIDYGRYPDAVAAMLREVLALQEAGDPLRVAAFVDRWGAWDEALHGRIAANIRAEQRYRYRLFTYGALGE
jgi:hypothetical protein